jgi:hypothetical protein
MIRTARTQDFAVIADALDETQRRMLRAIAPEASPMAALMRLAGMHPLAATVEREGKPVVIAGALINDPHTASVFLFCAADAGQAEFVAAATYFKNVLFPAMAAEGVRRLYHVMLADDPGASAWGRREQVLKAAGRNGEDLAVHSVGLPQPPQQAAGGVN